MRSWIGVLAALVFCLHSTDAVVTLTQVKSVSAAPGETVKISCTMSGDSIDKWYSSWYWKKPGSIPQLIWSEKNGRTPGISDRLQVSFETSQNRMLLTIANVKSEDAAVYYCYSARTFGKGTNLGVTVRRPPAVTIFRPSEEEIAKKSTATLVCLVSGFNPPAVNIEWTVDGSTRRNGVETSRVQQDTDNTFSANSYLTLSASDWSSQEQFSCVVKHETQPTPLQATIARSGYT
ncbi:immunoglobulin lambda-1 light chain-like [Hypanus sabinus]|uniref:immunoglobulin lambda-1 light chain-like n=1 Tax=Hypanus sabinus TaxID=79690 RepID=UPI0028C45BE3|nr:immunoglobulin lambda-1 light chain-like [Hypanus sabinus]